MTTTGDYIPHHEPFQYYTSTQNLHHVLPKDPALIGTSSDGANHQYDLSAFWTALGEDRLPAVTYLKAAAYQDAHPGYSDPIDEQNFIVGVVNAVHEQPASGKTRRSSSPTTIPTAGTITCSGRSSISRQCRTMLWPAAPNCGSATTTTQGRCGYGPRLPLIVISPYAKQNYVDHQDDRPVFDSAVHRG